jgi:hypothetical protein
MSLFFLELSSWVREKEREERERESSFSTEENNFMNLTL